MSYNRRNSCLSFFLTIVGERLCHVQELPKRTKLTMEDKFNLLEFIFSIQVPIQWNRITSCIQFATIATTKHSITWDKCKIVIKEDHKQTRWIREYFSIGIKKGNAINRDGACTFSQPFTSLFCLNCLNTITPIYGGLKSLLAFECTRSSYTNVQIDY